MILGALAILAVTASLTTSLRAEELPRLVVQLTVDQLRGDMLTRYGDRLRPDGLRRLTDRGLVYSNAHYGQGNTFTASGHAVLVTGADTAEHGMVANEWFDRESGKAMYATADARHGMSPANLSSTTIGDELIAASGGRSRVFSVAGKDRSAVIPGGRRGKAFWFDEKAMGFSSSTYYFAELPGWVNEWNDEKEARSCEASQKKGPPDPYRNPFARPKGTFNYTPCLDRVTGAFARELIEREKLGRGETTDYLAISFSGLDYVGHAYGPGSPQHIESLVSVDEVLASLFAHLDRVLGGERYLVVLSADHGVDEIPEARRAMGFLADRFYPKQALEQLNSALETRFETSENLIAAFVSPGLYLDRAMLDRAGIDAETAETALAQAARSLPGVAYAITRSDFLAGRVARTPILEKVVRGFHPKRSGDVVLVQAQFWYLYGDPEAFAAMHGSPYSYDTYVPVIFQGAGIEPGVVVRPIEPGSIAPTLAALLGTAPPSGSSAPVLPEVLVPDER